MYVPVSYQINNANEIEAFVSNLNERHPTWSDLITIDYFYHHHMPDYDGGLSFLDRIHNKLGEFHPEWNIADLKSGVRYAQNPVSVYADIIAYMFNEPRDLIYYGI